MEIILFIAIGLIVLYQTGKEAQTMLPISHVLLDPLYDKYTYIYKFPEGLLKAIAKVESTENPNADNGKAVGLMQLLWSNKLPSIPDWPPKSRDMLFDPDLNLHYASQILAWNLQRYGIKKAIATYNNWDAHNDPETGPFMNQWYVDRVIGNWPMAGEYVEIYV